MFNPSLTNTREIILCLKVISLQTENLCVLRALGGVSQVSSSTVLLAENKGEQIHLLGPHMSPHISFVACHFTTTPIWSCAHNQSAATHIILLEEGTPVSSKCLSPILTQKSPHYPENSTKPFPGPEGAGDP